MKQLISDFESHTNLWAPKDLLPIGIGYAGLGRWKDSERVYLRYLKLKPNDPLANRGLATVYSVQERYDEAVKLLEKAWCGGDDQSLPLVGALYMATDQHEKLGKLVPDLLRAKKTAKGILRDNTVSVLVGYAVEAKRFDEKVFAEAIDGVSDDWFLEREETLKVAIKGLRLSGENERADRLSTRAKKNGKGSTGK